MKINNQELGILFINYKLFILTLLSYFSTYKSVV